MDIRFSKSAASALVKSNKARLLREKIEQLAHEPLTLSANVKRLSGRDAYRLRVQDWRVIFRIEDDVLWIDDIAPRGAVYEERE